MKVRTDFVTNSSASLFLLGFRQKQLTQKQKNAILEYVENYALGIPVPGEAIETMSDWYNEKEMKKQAKKLHREGWTINRGVVSFECGDEEYAGFLQGLWEAIAKADPENTKLLDIDLDY